MKFQNERHEKLYCELLAKMKSQDLYRQMAAYLLALDPVLLKHADEVFDFEGDCILPYGTLQQPWQTHTSRKTTRLLFNLWNGLCDDFEGVSEENAEGREDIPSRYYSVDEIFSCSYAPYFAEALKIRFRDFF